MITLVVFFVLLFAGLPIVGTILASAVVFMATSDLAVLYDSIPIQFYGALEINSLLAIPLFLLVGDVLLVRNGEEMVAFRLSRVGS